jgi:phosphoesterase RecJ-like protein
MPIHWPRFVELVHSHDRFLLTSHIRPDCDALGSELGMAGVLDALGKEVSIVNAQKTPPNLQFIDPTNRLRTLGVDVQPHDLQTIEVLMVLDTSAWAQLGTMAEVVRGTHAHKLILDHHVGEDDMGAELFKNPQAEATGRLVMEAAHHLGVKITAEIATPLFAAIATDTGWFRFGSTSGATLRYAGELIDAGAVPSQIYASLYEQDTLPRLRLRGRILAHTETELDNRLAHTMALKEDFEATGALPSDTEDVINLTLAIAGTQVAVIFVEQPTGGFKLSFRSRTPAIDCNQIAKTFGGGGHKAAAGAFINAPWPAAQSQVLDVVRAAMR